MILKNKKHLISLIILIVVFVVGFFTIHTRENKIENDLQNSLKDIGVFNFINTKDDVYVFSDFPKGLSLPGKVAEIEIKNLTQEELNKLRGDFNEKYETVLQSNNYIMDTGPMFGTKIYPLAADGVDGSTYVSYKVSGDNIQSVLISQHFTADHTDNTQEGYNPICPCGAQYKIFISTPISLEKFYQSFK